MPELKIESGVKEYNLNGKVTVLFNPTDTNFVEKYFNVFSSLDERQTRYGEAIAKAESNAAVFELARNMDEEIRTELNSLFSTDICTPLLGEMSICALAGGLPIWANILLAMLDEMDSTFAQEKKATNPRLEKYIKKYKK